MMFYPFALYCSLAQIIISCDFFLLGFQSLLEYFSEEVIVYECLKVEAMKLCRGIFAYFCLYFVEISQSI